MYLTHSWVGDPPFNRTIAQHRLGFVDIVDEPMGEVFPDTGEKGANTLKFTRTSASDLMGSSARQPAFLRSGLQSGENFQPD